MSALLALSVFGPAVAVAQQETVTSRVMSRSWAATQVSDAPLVYRATRDQNDFSPLGAPARLRTFQAIATVEQATGYTVVRKTLYRKFRASSLPGSTVGEASGAWALRSVKAPAIACP